MAGARNLAALALVACLAGAAEADVAEGLALFERGDFDGAAAALEPGVAAGDPAAQYLLGIMYLNGMTVPPDDAAAQRLIRASAEQGHLPAQSELARMYRAGDGVEQDFAQMMHWYEQAAAQGDVGAQLFVADGYAYGVGVAPDPVEAYKWYEIAIQYWGPLAVRARDVVAERMTADQVAEAVQRAGAWLMEHGTAPAAGAGTQ